MDRGANVWNIGTKVYNRVAQKFGIQAQELEILYLNVDNLSALFLLIFLVFSNSDQQDQVQIKNNAKELQWRYTCSNTETVL